MKTKKTELADELHAKFEDPEQAQEHREKKGQRDKKFAAINWDAIAAKVEEWNRKHR